MSWRRFHLSAGPRCARRASAGRGGWILSPPVRFAEDERGDDVLDGRENRATETTLDGRQKRQPNREPARPRRQPQCGDRKSSSAWPCGARQIARLGQLSPPPFGAVTCGASRGRAAPGDDCASDHARSDSARHRPAGADGGRAGGVRERRRAYVAQGDDHRAQRSYVSLAAGRPGDLRIPLLRIARGIGSILRLSQLPRVPAGARAAARSGPLAADGRPLK